jgi:2,3-bisphosphoglycerate-independent phosphoglycerate mutase
MEEHQIAIRCNLVTVSETEGLPYEEQTILDHSSGEISTEDAAILLDAVRKELEDTVFHYYVGTSYRHLLIWDNGQVVPLTAPHDVLGQTIGQYLPQEALLRDRMKKSYEILKHHPLNEERKKAGLNPANSCWFWGAGTKPTLSSFQEKNQKKGAMISAVDLLKGIAVGSGMDNIEVEGANGTLHTNYEGKADAAVRALTRDGYDFVYIHVEAPDEMGHQGSAPRKIQAIEYLDQRIIRRVKEGLDAAGEDYRMLVLPDHPTPVAVRTHTSEPVPYLLYDSTREVKTDVLYNEKAAESTGIFVEQGCKLMEHLFSGN